MKKKLYLLLPVALLLLTSSGYAAQTNDIVHKIRILKNTIHTRSLTDVPDASIQNDVLSVSFEDSGMYSLYIEDNFGKDVIETDGAFGAAGTITGSIIPGPGTVAGAVGTGGTASIAECIRQLLK